MLSVGCYKATCRVGNLAIASEVKVSKSFVNSLPESKFSQACENLFGRGGEFSMRILCNCAFQAQLQSKLFCFLQCSSY